MRSITQHYEGKNIYTRPLQGKPHYRNSGIIYTTVTQYILIAVKSIYPLFEVLLPSGFEKLFSVLLPLFEVAKADA